EESTNSAVKLDSNIKAVVVEAGKNGNEIAETAIVTLVNTYTRAIYPVEASVGMKDHAELGTYQFVLTSLDDGPMPTEEDSTNDSIAPIIVNNGEAGQITFGNIYFARGDMYDPEDEYKDTRTYHYSIKQVKQEAIAEKNYVVDDTQYDMAEFQLAITLSYDVGTDRLTINEAETKLFKIEKGIPTEVSEIHFENEKLGSLKIQKQVRTDSDTLAVGKLADGVYVFKVYEDDGRTEAKKANGESVGKVELHVIEGADAKIEVDGLHAGTYYVKETESRNPQIQVNSEAQKVEVIVGERENTNHFEEKNDAGVAGQNGEGGQSASIGNSDADGHNGALNGAASGIATIINIFETTDRHVRISFVDEDGLNDALRVSKINRARGLLAEDASQDQPTFTLIANDGENREEDLEQYGIQATKQATPENNYAIDWFDLPKYAKDGSLMEYSIRQESVDGIKQISIEYLEEVRTWLITDQIEIQETEVKTENISIICQVAVNGSDTNGNLADGTYTFEIYDDPECQMAATYANGDEIDPVKISIVSGRTSEEIIEGLKTGTYYIRQTEASNKTVRLDQEVKTAVIYPDDDETVLTTDVTFTNTFTFAMTPLTAEVMIKGDDGNTQHAIILRALDDGPVPAIGKLLPDGEVQVSLDGQEGRVFLGNLVFYREHMMDDTQDYLQTKAYHYMVQMKEADKSEGTGKDSRFETIVTLSYDSARDVIQIAKVQFLRIEYGTAQIAEDIHFEVEGKPDSTEMPTTVPTATPTPEATAVPTAAPTPGATAIPTATPTPEATAVPTATPTPEATAVPTAAPTPEATAIPTATPTSEATAVPTAAPTPEATAIPTATPTPEATAVPTAAPTPEATAVPTATPTPTPEVIAVPTASPKPGATAVPTATPVPEMTVIPTATPTSVTKAVPTAIPTAWTAQEMQTQVSPEGSTTVLISGIQKEGALPEDQLAQLDPSETQQGTQTYFAPIGNYRFINHAGDCFD
ncbi:MAG: hypothetical protein IJ188_03380, partial [Clostridia bacterium]|nr:hypothetical protein [Clostridia bacterium]